jgi:hypothetical protein
MGFPECSQCGKSDNAHGAFYQDTKLVATGRRQSHIEAAIRAAKARKR